MATMMKQFLHREQRQRDYGTESGYVVLGGPWQDKPPRGAATLSFQSAEELGRVQRIFLDGGEVKELAVAFLCALEDEKAFVEVLRLALSREKTLRTSGCRTE